MAQLFRLYIHCHVQGWTYVLSFIVLDECGLALADQVWHADKKDFKKRWKKGGRHPGGDGGVLGGGGRRGS